MAHEVIADQVFLLMKRDYRVSRNVRAKWYFENLGKTVSMLGGSASDVEEQEISVPSGGDLEIVGIVPSTSSSSESPPAERTPFGSLRSGQKYSLTSQTAVTFLAKRYRLVFLLDLSPSVSIVDIRHSQVLFDKSFDALQNCLIGLTKSFVVPGGTFHYCPELYITVIAHTPFTTSHSDQVLLQGALVTQQNVHSLLVDIKLKLKEFENAEATALCRMLSGTHETSKIIGSHAVPKGAAVTSPEVSMVNMIRKGILAVQLLPENTSAGLIIVTDGVTAVPDVAVLQSILLHLRNATIMCSFIQIRSGYHPDCSFGHVAFSEFMQFIATATFGAFLPTFSIDLTDDERCYPNVYHKAMLFWTFQRALSGYKFDPDLFEEPDDSLWSIKNPIFSSSYRPASIRRRLCSYSVATSFANLLSVRLREGYTIREISTLKSSSACGPNQISVELILPWKDAVTLEYSILADWSAKAYEKGICVQSSEVEISVQAPYEFLCDIAQPQALIVCLADYRPILVADYSSFTKIVKAADRVVVHLHSFNTVPSHYTIPESAKNGVPIFYMGDVLEVCSRQKWLHTHRISLIMHHDTPLPRNLHLPSGSSNRYAQISCNQAITALERFLKQETTFTLLEDHSYVKLLYHEGSDVPTNFYIIRCIIKPLIVTLRLAFLGGTDCHERHKIVQGLRQRLLQLRINQRRDSTSVISLLRPPASPRRSLHNLATETSAFTTLRKPAEKFLIKYEKVPPNLAEFINYEEMRGKNRPPCPPGAKGGVTSARAAAFVYNTLARYLQHNRWIWSLKRPTPGFPISSQFAAIILQVLMRRRLHEGFKFAHSCSGILSFLLELEMRPLSCGDHVHNCDGITYQCVVQYVLYPPVPVVSVSPIAYQDDDLVSSEIDTIEADSDVQLITEFWTEPQCGRVINLAPNYNGCDYTQLPAKILEVDSEIIKTLATFSHLLLLWQDKSSAFRNPPPLVASPVPGGVKFSRKSSSAISPLRQTDQPSLHHPVMEPSVCNVAPFYDLPLLLQHSQLSVLLFPCLSSGLPLNMEVFGTHSKEVDLLNGTPATHNGQSNAQFQDLWTHILQRIQPHAKRNHRICELIKSISTRLTAAVNCKSVTISGLALPHLRCYLKFVAEDRLILLLLPSTFDDVVACGGPGNKPDVASAVSGKQTASFDDKKIGGDSESSADICFACGGSGSEHEEGSEDEDFDAEVIEDDVFALPHFYHRTSSRKSLFNGQAAGSEVGGAAGQHMFVFVFSAYLPRIASRLSNGKRPSFFGDRVEDFCQDYEDNAQRSVLSQLHTQVSRISYSDEQKQQQRRRTQFAADGKCEEATLEIDISKFILLICQHARDVRDQTNSLLPRCNTFDSDVSLTGSGNEPAKPKIVCGDIVHREIARHFRLLIERQFTAVPCCPEYFYLRPELNEKQRCALISDVAEDDTVAFIRDTNGEGRTNAAEEQPRPSLHSMIEKLNHQLSTSLESIVSSDTYSESNGQLSPLFLQLTCSIRCGNDAVHCGVDSLPTCLAKLVDLSRLAEMEDERQQPLQVTLDLVVLTFYPDLTFSATSTFGLAGNSDSSSSSEADLASERNRKEAGSCGRLLSNRGPGYDDGELVWAETANAVSSETAAGLKSQLSRLADERHRGVLSGLVTEIRFFLDSEVAFALRHLGQIDEDTLQTVVAQVETCVDDSAITTAAVQLIEVPLVFVMKEADSMEKFTAELPNLRVENWTFVRCGRYLYAEFSPKPPADASESGVRSLLVPVIPCLTEEVIEAFQRIADSVDAPSSAEAAKTSEGQMTSRPSFFISTSQVNADGSPADRQANAETTQSALPARLRAHSRSRSYAGFGDLVSDLKVRCESGGSGQGGNSNNRKSRIEPSLLGAIVKKSASFANTSIWKSSRSGFASVGGGSERASIYSKGIGDLPDEGSSTCLSNLGDHELDNEAQATEDPLDEPPLDPHEKALSQQRQLWLVLKVEHLKVVVVFLQRSERHSDEICAQTVSQLQKLVTKVNQFMLLESLFETRICSDLLVPNPSEEVHLREKNASVSSDDLNDPAEPPDAVGHNGQGHTSYLAVNARFRHGHFACECVWHTFFSIHPRLKTASASHHVTMTSGGNGVARGLQAMKSLLNKFFVIGRENLFVIRDDNGQVFYLCLHDNVKSAKAAAGALFTAPKDLLASIREEDEKSAATRSSTPSSARRLATPTLAVNAAAVQQRFSHSDCIFLTVHGIATPGKDIKEHLVNALQHKLDDAVLSSLSDTLRRNPNAKLTAADVEFIQPVGELPLRLLQLQIGHLAFGHLYALWHYLKQHFGLFAHRPSYMHDSYRFRAYLGYECYDTATIFLFNRPPEHGGRGICCLSLCFVNPHGEPMRICASDSIDSENWIRYFYAGLDFDALVVPKVYERTPTGYPVPLELPESGPGSVGACVQVAVWERGNAHFLHLEQKLTEYGLLSVPAWGLTCAVTPNVAVSEPGSPTQKDSLTNSGPIRKRHSSAAFNPPGAAASRARSHFNFDLPHKLSDDVTHLRGSASVSGSCTKLNSAGVESTVCLHPVYAQICSNWFDYVASKSPEADSIIKRFTLSLSADSCRLQFLAEAFNILERSAAGSTDVRCFAKRPATDFGASIGLQQPIFEDFKPTRPADSGLPLPDPLALASNASANDASEYIIVAQSLALLSDTLKFSHDAQAVQVPKTILELTDAQNAAPKPWQFFAPLVASGFVPRQRLLFLRLHEKTVSVYTYNWSKEMNFTLENVLTKTAQWQCARAALLRQICLQKMGLFKVSASTEDEMRRNSYLSTCWLIPECFIKYQRPPPVLPRAPDLQRLNPLYSRLQSPWRDDSGSIWHWTNASFRATPNNPTDPLHQQGNDLNELRHHLRSLIDRQVRLEALWQLWQRETENGKASNDDQGSYSSSGNTTATIKEDLLNLLADLGRLIHFVYTPLLFSPQWREKVAVVRCPTADATKHLIPQPVQALRSRHSSGQSSGGGAPLSPHPGVATQQTKERVPSATLASSKDGWHYYLQHLFCSQYVKYLCHLGLHLVNVENHPDVLIGRQNQLQVDPLSAAASPEVWLQKTSACGILLIHMYFSEPYFLVYVYNCDRSVILGRCDAISNEMTKQFANECSKILSLSHLHSFSYDFHLRTVQSYLVGRQLIFKPGYYINAFLNDFLSYYNCRPGFARTFLFEDICHVSGLSTSPANLYNYLLDNDKIYGLKVIKMRLPSASSGLEAQSEYLLASFSKYTHVFSDGSKGGSSVTEEYDVIQFLMQDPAEMSPADSGLSLPLLGQQQTGAIPKQQHLGYATTTRNGNQTGTLRLKFYLIFINSGEHFPRASTGDISGQYRRVLTGDSPSTSTDDSQPPSELPSPERSPVKKHRAYQFSSSVQNSSMSGRALMTSPHAHGGRYPRNNSESATDRIVTESLSIDTSEPSAYPNRHGYLRQRSSLDATASLYKASRFCVEAVQENPEVSPSSQTQPDFCREWHDRENNDWRRISGEDIVAAAASSEENAKVGSIPQASQTSRMSGRGSKRSSRTRRSTCRTMEDSSLQPETVTYMTFVSPQQHSMQKAVEVEAAKAKEKLKQMLAEAMQHCRRDQLWKKLLYGVTTESEKGSREISSVGISFAEFEELLGYVNYVSLTQFDAKLQTLLAIPVSWRKDLSRSFSAQFGGHFREFFEPNDSKAKVYFTILNSNDLDTLVLFTFDMQRRSTSVSVVYRDVTALVLSESNVENRQFRELQVKNFCEDVVNTLACHIWTRMLS